MVAILFAHFLDGLGAIDFVVHRAVHMTETNMKWGGKGEATKKQKKTQLKMFSWKTDYRAINHLMSMDSFWRRAVSLKKKV